MNVEYSGVGNNINCVYNKDNFLCENKNIKNFLLFLRPRCIEFCENKICSLKEEIVYRPKI